MACMDKSIGVVWCLVIVSRSHVRINNITRIQLMYIDIYGQNVGLCNK